MPFAGKTVQDSLSIFFGNDPDILQDVQKACTPVSFVNGATILAQEEESKTVYCIIAGTAKALLYSEGGDEIWLDEFGPGALFGEMAVLGSQIRTADIVATSPVKVAAFSEESFLSLMQKHGSIGIRVARMLVERIQQTTRRMFELSSLSAKGRVYAELLRLAKTDAHSKLLVIERLPSFTSFAQRISSTRETVSRTVNELARLGYVSRTGKKLVVLMPEEIRNLQDW
ncbi:Crp/Fnr family transcriptional regulator [Kordiimonas pumila]|uniref:Crp/Fnr family transcriptional regulator n=1 Tax=Kordiimonas pumila TaxID=2161677 RepID=A0ABV7D0R6_9PROT|nr:Crp/Fnr family transcriptional regulator [Kordiimonas pumila]